MFFGGKMKKIIAFVAVSFMAFAGFSYSVKKEIVKPAEINLCENKNLGMMVETPTANSSAEEFSFSISSFKLQFSGKNNKRYSVEEAIGEDFLSEFYKRVSAQNYFECYDSYFTKKKITDGESMPSTAFVVFTINRFNTHVRTEKKDDELVWKKEYDLRYTIKIFDGETRKLYFSDKGNLNESEISRDGDNSFSDYPKIFTYRLESIANDLSRKIHPQKNQESMKLLQEKKVSGYKQAEKILKKNDFAGAKRIYSELADEGSFEAAYDLVILETVETTFANGADLMGKLAAETGDKRAEKEAASLKKLAEMETVSAEREARRNAVSGNE